MKESETLVLYYLQAEVNLKNSAEMRQKSGKNIKLRKEI
jgi:hypothetical protein